MLNVSESREQVGRKFHDLTFKGPSRAEIWKILQIWPLKKPADQIATPWP